MYNARVTTVAAGYVYKETLNLDKLAITVTSVPVTTAVQQAFAQYIMLTMGSNAP